MQNSAVAGARTSARPMQHQWADDEDVSRSCAAGTILRERHRSDRCCIQNAKEMGTLHDLERAAIRTGRVDMNTQCD
jgi:hypothetical protein